MNGVNTGNELTKEEAYQSILEPIRELLGSEPNLIANLANFTAVLKDTFPFLWVGFYLVEREFLVLGPFQGNLACTRIGYGIGVCGSAWKGNTLINVPNVEDFPGHIACSPLAKSELVVPLVHEGKIWGVLDVDSTHENYFDEIDERYLVLLTSLLAYPSGA